MMTDQILGASKEVFKEAIVNKIKEFYKYINNYKDNVQLFQGKFKQLEEYHETISNQVKRDSENSRRSTRVTEGWLEKVECFKEENEVKELINDEIRKQKDQCCCGRFHYNLCERYKMSLNAEKKAQEIDRIIKDDKPPDGMITEPTRRSEMELIPTEFLKSLDSRVNLMNDILENLQEDNVDSFGLFGMGGLGKTTLVKEIANKGGRGLFDEIVIAEISEAPSIERVQYRIAEQLGLTLTSQDHEGRALELHNRLKKGTANRKQAGDNNKRTILVILDNLWEKLDLSSIGIPTTDEKTQDFCCKILITSRNKNVCEAMGVFTSNIREVHTLEEDEARKLFRARVGDRTVNEQLEQRLLGKCGGLPLAIVAVADVLKGKELSFWEEFAIELEKPARSRATTRDALGHTYLILETSYKIMEPQEKKIFFLLACLFPPGSSIPIEDMLRYGIGLGLFQYVNNLTEAMEQANTWILELISSSLLLEDHRRGHVKIHDMVRESAIAMIQKGKNKILVDNFPRWLWEETFQKYSAVSLRHPSHHSRLSGLISNNLQILVLDGTQPKHEFADTFFQGMTNLKVLVLRSMDFSSGLPQSIKRLKKTLKVLCLEKCKLGDIGDVIGELTNLLVLSLRGSLIKQANMPAEGMSKLEKLCVLDLNLMTIIRTPDDFFGGRVALDGVHRVIIPTGNEAPTIPAKFLYSLSQLEGLYASDIEMEWASRNDNDDEPSISGLNYLKVVEIGVSNSQLPVNEDIVNNLDKFAIFIGGKMPFGDFLHAITVINLQLHFPECNCKLMIGELNVSSAIEKNHSSVKALLKKTERLVLVHTRGLEQFADYHWRNGSLKGVKQLIMVGCYDIRYAPTRIAYLNLEYLFLRHLPKLEKMNHAKATFTMLRLVKLENLPLLQPYALPIGASSYPHLVTLVVDSCPLLKFLFGKEDRRVDLPTSSNSQIADQFPSLKLFKLCYLEQLESVLGVASEQVDSTNFDGQVSQRLQDSPVLFDAKLTLPALETVDLQHIYGIVTVWDVKCGNYNSRFHNLKELSIGDCRNLKSVCPLCVAAALTQLTILEIWYCNLMREVITWDDEKMQHDDNTSISLFPRLETLILRYCSNLQWFIAANQRDDFIQLSSLQRIVIDDCPKLQSFSSSATFEAPNLRVVEFNSNEYTKQDIGDINQFLQSQCASTSGKGKRVSR